MQAARLDDQRQGRVGPRRHGQLRLRFLFNFFFFFGLIPLYPTQWCNFTYLRQCRVTHVSLVLTVFFSALLFPRLSPPSPPNSDHSPSQVAQIDN